MKNTTQRFDVPAGYSGWWCGRCEKEITGIPDDVDAAQLKCPKCHKWTVRWIPSGLSEPPAVQASAREKAGEVRALSAGPGYQRKTPTASRLNELFAHMREVIEHPEIEPDLRKIEDEQYKR